MSKKDNTNNNDIIKKLAHQLAALNTKNNKNKNNDHKFWNTQPVPQTETELEHLEKVVEIEPTKSTESVSNHSQPLPNDYEWSTINVNNRDELVEIYELLNLNYGEDNDELFRFDYSMDFLSWALKPPMYQTEWHVGVRVKKNKKLVAFVSAIPITMNIKSIKEKEIVEINFLCVHKILRNKRLAPVLIKEITRRVNKKEIYQAVYTAGVKIPTPIAYCPYYHRPLNQRKLIEIGFSYLKKNETLDQAAKYYQLKKTKPKIRLINRKDKQELNMARIMLNEYLQTTTELCPKYLSEEDFEHWFVPFEHSNDKRVVWTYVVEDPTDNKISDMVSFYELDSSILSGKNGYKKLKAAYLWYYATNAKTDIKKRLTELVREALIIAQHELDMDVFNCVDIMQNNLFFEELDFNKGDGGLNYYLFNYKCAKLESNQIGFVML